MGHQISEAEARERVMKVNNTLREAGKTWEEIEAFWQDCINQAKANNAGAQNFGNTPGDKHASTGEVYIKSKNQSHGDSE